MHLVSGTWTYWSLEYTGVGLEIVIRLYAYCIPYFSNQQHQPGFFHMHSATKCDSCRITRATLNWESVLYRHRQWVVGSRTKRLWWRDGTSLDLIWGYWWDTSWGCPIALWVSDYLPLYRVTIWLPSALPRESRNDVKLGNGPVATPGHQRKCSREQWQKNP